MYEISLSFNAPSWTIGKNMPRPKNSALCLSAIFGTMRRISSESFNVSLITSGNALSSDARFFLGSLSLFRLFAIDMANSIRPASWVVKALVEATPISGPALVNKTCSDSLANELVGTLQIERVLK